MEIVIQVFIRFLHTDVFSFLGFFFFFFFFCINAPDISFRLPATSRWFEHILSYIEKTCLGEKVI